MISLCGQCLLTVEGAGEGGYRVSQ
jgi:hypothetical protein